MAITFSSAISGFIKTGVWMVAAIVSLGFAAYEKAEKYGYSEQLAQVVTDLDLANRTASILRSEIVNPSSPPPALLASGDFAPANNERMMMAAPPMVGSSELEPNTSPAPMTNSAPSGNEDSSPADELIRIDARLNEELARKPLNDALINQLIRRQQYLKTITGQF